jgi:hypothetical protein
MSTQTGSPAIGFLSPMADHQIFGSDARDTSGATVSGELAGFVKQGKARDLELMALT